MKRVLAAFLSLGLAVLAGPLAGAAHQPDADGCPKHISDASIDNPHVVDPANDWEGAAFGNESATVPAGDVYREGTDVISTWISRDEQGNLFGNIRTGELSEMQPNAIFYLLWTYEGSDPTRSRRFVSARLKGYGMAASYGYHSVNPVTGNPAFITEGETTLKVDPVNNVLSVAIPRGGKTTLSGVSTDDWGAPAQGAELAEILAEARLLVGSPEQLPPNPAGYRHGNVYLADNTSNFESACNAYVD